MKQKTNPQPFDLEEMNKLADEIMEMFCVVDDRPYPEGTGIWGMDTELFSTEENETARSKARKKIITKIKQRIKSACEFYLRYVDNPNGFFYSPYQNLIDSKEMYLLIFELVRYSVLSKLPPKKIEGIMLKLQKYNEWLFKLSFKDVLENENKN